VRRAALCATVFAALMLAGSAQGATWKVLVGEQTKPPAGTPKGTTLNQFFPGQIDVNVGDKVTFQSRGFHTVSYLAGKPVGPAGFIPDPAKALYENILDADGQPFYFNGLPKFVFNLAAFAPSGPKVVANARVNVSSGIIAPGPNGKPVSATYTFPTQGGYKMICAIHPGMEMVVNVKATGAPVQTAQDVAGRAKVEVDAAWAKAKTLAAAKTPANTVYQGVGGKTTILGFFPKELRVKAGTAVSFVNKAPSEPHNVAFGPKKYLDQFAKQHDLFPMGPNAKNQAAPVHVYGTDPRGQYSYDGKNHGNGFFVTPLTDAVPASPLPAVSRVTFTAPGRYHYICFLHGPDMAGDIVVTP
jgi:plastocyanin